MKGKAMGLPASMLGNTVVAAGLATCAALASVSLAACAELDPDFGASPSSRVVERIEYGVVDRIDLYRSGNSQALGLGSIVGGLAGGVIGHQIGGGRGNDLATVAGALGGALAGNSIEKARQGDRYRITVRLDDGKLLVLEQAGEGELHVGDRVRVVNGRVHRA
jgi:outer membrane lipoprotein SlyB